MSQPHHISPIALLSIRQEKGESLCAFMEWFVKVSLSIRNLMPEIAMHHLVSILWPDQFTDNLIKRSTKNLDELRNQATKFMQIKELRDFYKSVWLKNRWDKGKEKDRGTRSISCRSNRFWENRVPWFYTYTPMNAARCKIMDEALQVELLPALKQLQSSRTHRYF